MSSSVLWRLRRAEKTRTLEKTVAITLIQGGEYRITGRNNTSKSFTLVQETGGKLVLKIGGIDFNHDSILNLIPGERLAKLELISLPPGM